MIFIPLGLRSIGRQSTKVNRAGETGPPVPQGADLYFGFVQICKRSTLMTRGAISLNTTARAPTEKPPFTIGTLRKAIPPHCFERSILRSATYLAVDILLASFLFAFSQLLEARAPAWLALLAWPVYWFFQVTSESFMRFAWATATMIYSRA